ncbi:hypothetical protein D3790_14625 [Xenorhabdus nematophila]|nr:hypothetical protein D3790_14625 [Xenorhabdus nematophila]
MNNSNPVMTRLNATYSMNRFKCQYTPCCSWLFYYQNIAERITIAHDYCVPLGCTTCDNKTHLVVHGYFLHWRLHNA